MSNIDLIYGIWYSMTSEPGPADVLHVQLLPGVFIKPPPHACTLLHLKALTYQILYTQNYFVHKLKRKLNNRRWGKNLYSDHNGICTWSTIC